MGAVVSWSGPTRLGNFAEENGCVTQKSPGCDPGIPGLVGGPAVFRFEGSCAPVQGCADRYDQTSPYLQATPDYPPALFVHGLADTLVPLEQPLTMAAKLVSMRDLQVSVQPCPTKHDVSVCATPKTISFLMKRLG